MLEFFRSLISDMHSDYYVPRIIRMFSGERFPSVLELKTASIYDMYKNERFSFKRNFVIRYNYGEQNRAMYYSGFETGYVSLKQISFVV